MRKAVRAIIVRDGNLLVMHRNKFGEEYYTLLGGGIRPGETADQALRREIKEESNFTVTTAKLVYVEDAGDPYGSQYIYYCEAVGDEPRLHPDSDEAKIAELGKNLHTPVWLPISELGSVKFRSVVLQRVLEQALQKGFPREPVMLDSKHIY